MRPVTLDLSAIKLETTHVMWVTTDECVTKMEEHVGNTIPCAGPTLTTRPGELYNVNYMHLYTALD